MTTCEVKTVICIHAESNLCDNLECIHYKLHEPREVFTAEHLNCNQFRGCTIYSSAYCINVKEENKNERS